MNCESARQILDGEEPEMSQELLGHLAGCKGCREHSEATQLIKAPMRAPRISRTISQQRAVVPTGPSSSALWIVGGVAIFLVVGTIGFLALRHFAMPQVSEPIAVVAPLVTPDPIKRPEPERIDPALIVQVTQRRITVESEPSGSNLFFDGRRRGVTPLTVSVPEGRTVVEVRADGFRTARKTVVVKDGDLALRLVLDKSLPGDGASKAAAPATPAPTPSSSGTSPGKVASKASSDEEDRPVSAGYGFVTVSSEPWAKLFVDGKDTGRSTPIVRMSLPVGKHQLELKARSASVTVEVDVVKGREARISKTIEE